jgi:hypothetical protein
MKNLFIMTVPQWQGSAAGTAPYHGAKSMAKMVGSDIIDAEIAVREQLSLPMNKVMVLVVTVNPFFLH